MDSSTPQLKRLLVVSNRLPFTVTEEGGELQFGASSGGLVTGLSAYLESIGAASDDGADYIWVGWPGISTEDTAVQDELRVRAAADFQAHPVFVGAEEMNLFYHGFTNQTLWPLFHYFSNFASFDEASWQNYRHVNEIFCDAVMEVIRPDDTVWIHDYHLMLLPQMIRERMPDVRIGFFLHIPFPAYEIFRLLPRAWRSGILEGLLGADLVGFHTYEYTQYFARAVLLVLGRESNLGRILLGERVLRLDTFPMSIDYRRFHDAPNSPEVQDEMRQLAPRLADVKVVLSIDRLDYTKGIINRLEGYLAFLQNNPEWHGKVLLALVVIPSRAGVEDYKDTKIQIEELVGRINGQFGSITWTPILYQYRSVPFANLIALYCSGDIALVTPLRDGMNLIAKEYVASRTDGSGVLVLSELTGAATELGEALLITPTSREEIAEALLTGLEMPVEEQQRRMRLMQERISSYDVATWAGDFIEQLSQITYLQAATTTVPLAGERLTALLSDFRGSERRLFFFDYDGTLVPFAPRPELAAPDEEIMDLLERLSSNPRNEVVIVSGRDQITLGRWLGHLPLAIVAEHGSWIKLRDGEWRVAQPLTDEWKAQIRPILERYAHRLPGALVEEKSFSLAWHFRQADPELAAARAKELLDHLTTLTANLDVRVLQGNKVLEIRPTTISKAMVQHAWALGTRSDFILTIGDDWTDEDMFTAVPSRSYTIKVGPGATAARFRLRSQPHVRGLLRELASDER